LPEIKSLQVVVVDTKNFGEEEVKFSLGIDLVDGSKGILTNGSMESPNL